MDDPNERLDFFSMRSTAYRFVFDFVYFISCVVAFLGHS